VNLEPGPVDGAASQALMEAMAHRLRHHGSERLDLHLDPERGFALGRIALEHTSPLPWPGNPDTAAFVHGVLHPGTPGPEALLEAHRRRGPGAFHELRGFFSALVRDQAKGTTALTTDACGSCPVFYTEHRGRLYFAPEVKALLAIEGLSRETDPAALGIFLASGFVLTHQTLLRDVHRLEGGRALVIENGRVRAETWREHRLSPEGDGTPVDELEDQLVETLRRSVMSNYVDSETDAIFLSGGGDSRILLAGALEKLDGDGSRIRVVSWTSDDNPPGSDVAVARDLAKRYGLRHEIIERELDDFGERAAKLNHLLDGLSDVAAFHGFELEIMRRLSERGIRRVLRGDQSFTYGIKALGVRNSIVRMCIRSASQPAGLAGILREGPRREITSASDAELDRLAAEYAKSQADDAGDELYFHHRLQGYLNPAGYFKQIYHDHRNPLLDEEILDLVTRLPVTERLGQKIFRRAAERAYPELWNLPFAESNNLENYPALLAADTPVRRWVEKELADIDHPAWEVLDREALTTLLERHKAARGGRPWAGELKTQVRRTLRDALFKVAPPLQRRVRHAYLTRVNRLDETLFRAMLLKQWLGRVQESA